MYNLVTAILMAKDKPTGLNEVDISRFTLQSTLSEYTIGYLVLTNTYLQGELFITLDVLRGTDLGLGSYDITITEWLKQNGNKTLPHSIIEPEYEFSKLNYIDLHQGGFEKSAVHPYSTIPDYPVSSLTDLYVKKDAIDTNLLVSNCVVTVNGYLHTHSRYKQGIKVVDGCRTAMFSKRGQYGLISFNDAGGVTLQNINRDMIHRSHIDVSYYQEVVIELGRSLTGKGIMLSLAGQLITSSDVVKVIDLENGIVVINIARLNFIDRIQQALQVIEMPELLMLTDNDNIDQVQKDTITSDPFILAVLRMSQTFLLITEQPNFTVKREPVYYQGVYGRYFSERFNYDIMVDAYGRIVPYFYYGNLSHPFMSDKHIYQVPIEYTEKTQNIRNRHKWRYKGPTFNESITNHTEAMPLDWLDVQFVKPA